MSPTTDRITHLIMVSYHRPNDLVKSVKSIINYTRNYHLTIIDNSTGKINNVLEKYKSHPNITVHHNDHNIGKGRAFKTWYPAITEGNKAEYFVSVDADIEVGPNWLDIMLEEAENIKKTMPFGALAPMIIQHGASAEQQITTGQFQMHVVENQHYITPTAFYNYQTAGSIFLIDRAFYEKIGGYPGDRLYGNDDAFVCLRAQQLGLFVGITTATEIIHLNQDSVPAYSEWKNSHITNVDTTVGYWDL